jgi:hypothetical protein
MKSDVSEIRADLITEVHAMENKMNNCMNVIGEELQTPIGDLCAGQAELQGRPGNQQKNVNSMVEQQTRNLREGFEVAQRKFEAQLALVENRTRRACGRGPGTNTFFSEATEIRRCNILGSVSPTASCNDSPK